MKKAIAIIISIAIILSLGATAYADCCCCCDSKSSTPEPSTFTLYYTQNGERIEEELTSEVFGTTISLDVDYGTIVQLWIYDNTEEGFNLSEIMFMRYGQQEYKDFCVYKYVNHVNLHMFWEESMMVMINIGTHLEPNWVSFKIETYLYE